MWTLSVATRCIIKALAHLRYQLERGRSTIMIRPERVRPAGTLQLSVFSNSGRHQTFSYTIFSHQDRAGSAAERTNLVQEEDDALGGADAAHMPLDLWRAGCSRVASIQHLDDHVSCSHHLQHLPVGCLAHWICRQDNSRPSGSSSQT